MKKMWFVVTSSWQPLLVGVLMAVLFICLLTFRLGTLTPGANVAEIITKGYLQSFSNIVKEPINAPFYLVRNILQSFYGVNVTTARITAVLFGLASIASFYALAKLWYSTRVAILGTLLFTSSSWLLHVARFGTPDVLVTSIILLVLLYVWLERHSKRSLIILVSSVTIAVLLYVPGMIWFVVVGLLWRIKHNRIKNIKPPDTLSIISYVLFVLLIIPLLLSIIKSPHIMKLILGFPSTTMGFSQFLTNIINVPIQIMFHSKLDPTLTVGHLPFLDIFSVVMLIIGCYEAIRTIKLDRNKAVLGIILLGSLLTALGGLVTISLLLPAVYLLIMAGIAYLLDEWFTIFPRNPLAGNIGAIIMTITVLLTMFYHINSYFIAWPNAPATKAAFSRPLD